MPPAGLSGRYPSPPPVLAVNPEDREEIPPVARQLPTDRMPPRQRGTRAKRECRVGTRSVGSATRVKSRQWGHRWAASHVRGWGMAETGQRFTLHARSWNIPRIIGYPAGLRWNRETQSHPRLAGLAGMRRTRYASAIRGADAVLKSANEAEDQTVLSRLAAVLEAPDPDFAIVIPCPGEITSDHPEACTCRSNSYPGAPNSRRGRRPLGRPKQPARGHAAGCTHGRFSRRAAEPDPQEPVVERRWVRASRRSVRKLVRLRWGRSPWSC
jgi:hypothetical protein